MKKVADTFKRYITDSAFRARISSVSLQEEAYSPQVALYKHTRPSLQQAPITFSIMMVCIIVAMLTGFGQGGPLLRILLIIDPLAIMDLAQLSVKQLIAIPINSGEIWRYISPDFLHFSFSHLSFNLVLFWFLGGQLEQHLGKTTYVLVFLMTSVVSNTAQLIASGPIFGGISGVVYALVGFCWVYKRKHNQLDFPEALIVVSAVWLVMGFTPLFEWLGIGRMANTAHLTGLVSGMLLALLLPSKKMSAT